MEPRNLVLGFVHMGEHRHEEPGHREVVHAVVGLGVDILAAVAEVVKVVSRRMREKQIQEGEVT